jgi:hypothetical protein
MTDAVPVRLLRMDVSVETVEMRPPQSILQDAMQEKAKPPFFCSSDYAESVRVLRDEKGMTWKEIGQWFEDRGVSIAWASLRAAYYRMLLAERISNVGQGHM